MKTLASILLSLFLFTFFLPKFPLSTAHASSCSDQITTALPDIFQIQRSGSSAELSITPLQTSYPVTGYTISYGVQPKDDQYATSFSYGPSSGVIVYTIGDLDPQESYVFKIQANNGCASGPWSEDVSDNFHPVATSTSTEAGTTKSTLLVAGNWETPAILAGISVLFVVSGLLFLL